MFKFYSSKKWVPLSNLYILKIIYAILYNSRFLLGESWKRVKKNDSKTNYIKCRNIVKLDVGRNIFQSISINLTFPYERLNNY